MFKKLSIFALIYSISILLSRIIGLVREGVIGRILGTSQEADIYWMAFILPDFLNYLLAGGAVGLIFIPLLHQIKANHKEDHEYFSKILFSFSILVLTITCILYLYMPKLIIRIAPGYQEAQLNQLLSLSRLLLWAQPIHLISALFSAELQAKDLHKAPAIAPLFYTLGIIFGGLLLGPTMGAKGFVYGVLIGAFIGPFLINVSFAFYHGLRLNFTWLFRPYPLEPGIPSVLQFYTALLPIMLGFSIVIFDDIFMKKFATFFDTGLVSQLQYARALMKVPMGIFGMALGVATFSTLSQLWQEKKEKQAFELLSQASLILLLLCFFSQLLLAVCSKELIILIWGMKRFTWADIEQISVFTRLFSWSIFFWSAQSLFSRIYYVKRQNWLPTVIGSAITLLSYFAYGLVHQAWVQEIGVYYLIYVSFFGISSYFVFLLVLLLFNKDHNGEHIGKILLKPLYLMIKLSLLAYVLLYCFDLLLTKLGLAIDQQWLYRYDLQSSFSLIFAVFWRMAIKGIMLLLIGSMLLFLLPFREIRTEQQILISKLRKKISRLGI